ncbi:MAG: hypothetical protein VKI83_11150 [Synechococcaceae cyanobacterium]|nr:hypothetical protein [Synechococcaceae cyanobacterium]
MSLRRRLLWIGLGLGALLLVPGTGLVLGLVWPLLHRSFGLAVDLLLVGLLLFLIAAFFAPLEALGWWAGWFGEELAPPAALGALAAPLSDDRPVRRWVVYLDGIGQASADALPEGEAFLQQLAGRLSEEIAIVRGINPYSVVNQPLTSSGWLATFWRWVDRLRLSHPRTLLGLLINLRNVTVVAVSADKRYGPIFNQGTARVIVDTLMAHGYRPGSGTPVTLLGFSGGGQISLGALPHLRQLLQAPVEVISLGGVFAGNNRFLQAEHLYHLVGSRDQVERIGPLAFPGRWRIQLLSYWNRARRRGKVSLIPLGPVGHELPGGLFDAELRLADGRTPLQQTLDLVSGILQGRISAPARPLPPPGNYALYSANPWQRPSIERDLAPLPSVALQPRQSWIGRLILPPPERRGAGPGFEAEFEVFATPPDQRRWRGHTLRLQWLDPLLQPLVMDLHFSDEACASLEQGRIHPQRLNHWRQVTPLESLAGARPADDQLVRLPEPVTLLEEPQLQPLLRIASEPVQTSGLARTLVRFLAPCGPPQEQLWQAVAFDPQQRRFGGERLLLRLPPPRAGSEGILPASSAGLERGPLNELGWYVGGVPDGQGAFVVQTMLPRALVRFRPDRVICGRRAAWHYLRREAWADPVAGSVSSVLLSGRDRDPEQALAEWRPGDRLLVLHLFGGIGGEQREAALSSGLCTGHFAYGLAELVQEPLAGETSLRIRYRQVYAHNPDGLIAGVHDRWRYLGDRQWGWLGSRPIADILVRFPPFTSAYNLNGAPVSPLDGFARQLTAMMARYRIGDGTGATFVGPANNCAQDSNQALFAAIRQLQAGLRAMQGAELEAWRRRHPEEAERLAALLRLERDLRRVLLPFGGLRDDWQRQAFVLGSSLEDRPLQNLLRGLGSWRTLLPRLASDTVMRVFLRHGASALVLRANQVGGEHASIAPVAPFTL